MPSLEPYGVSTVRIELPINIQRSKSQIQRQNERREKKSRHKAQSGTPNMAPSNPPVQSDAVQIIPKVIVDAQPTELGKRLFPNGL